MGDLHTGDKGDAVLGHQRHLNDRLRAHRDDLVDASGRTRSPAA
jgi:hypothetical protein